MRHLLSAIIGFIAFACAFMGWSQYRNSHPKTANDSDTTSVSRDSLSLISTLNRESEEKEVYWGDTIWHSGDSVLCVDHCIDEDPKDPASVEYTYLVMIKDSVPLDTCIIEEGFTDIKVDIDDLVIVLGIDSLRYDVRNLPKRLKPVLSTLGVDNCKHHKFAINYSATNSDWKICNTYLEAYLPQQIPSWTKQVLDILVKYYVCGDEVPDNKVESLLPRYRRRLANKSSQAKQSPEQIMSRHANNFKRAYMKQWGPDSVEYDGPKCDRVFRMNPVWRSSDGQYITYRIYNYSYDNGAHGGMAEYYLTFNQKTGKLLGIRDLVNVNKIPQVYAAISDRITEHTHKWSGNYDSDWRQVAEYEYDNKDIKRETFRLERINGKVYPRPALTRQGLVVSYQPYEKGCFAEGILHFVVPYDQLKNSLKIKR